MQQGISLNESAARDEIKIDDLNKSLGISEGLQKRKVEDGAMGGLLKKLALFGRERGQFQADMIMGSFNEGERSLVDTMKGLSPEAQIKFADELKAGVQGEREISASALRAYEKHFAGTPFVERLKQSAR